MKYAGENEKMILINQKTVIEREDGVPYLIRRTLLSIGKWFSIKVHDIVQSDDACLHDHPWPFLSIILKGGYYEWSYPIKSDWSEAGAHDYLDMFSEDVVDYAYDVEGNLIVKKWYGPGSVLIRPANWAHRLELPVTELLHYDPSDGGTRARPIPCKTLVFTGKVCRPWGFFTKNGWVHWLNYEKKRDCI